MSYHAFLSILILGTLGSLVVAFVRPRFVNLSRWAIPIPFCLGWIMATFDYVYYVLLWHR